MNIDSIVDAFFTVPTLIMCVGIFVFVQFVRTIIETYLYKNIVNLSFWSKIVIPFSALFVGALIGFFAKKFPFPSAIGESAVGRAEYGCFCGLISSWVVTRVKDIFKKVAGDSPVDNTITNIINK
jgi:hypothetical protein